MHPKRKEAEAAYQTALAEWYKAADGTDLEAFDKADEALDKARKNACLVAAKYPTIKERRQENRELCLRNRGMDI